MSGIECVISSGDDLDLIYQEVKCPYCGHPATFIHEPGVNFGILSCGECDRREEAGE